MSTVTTDLERQGGSLLGRLLNPSRASLTVLAVTALVARLLIACVLYPILQKYTGLSHGSDGYEHIAITVVAGGGYRFAPDLGETMILLPAYPMFLALLFKFTGPSILAAQIAQSILDALSCLLIYRVVRRSVKPRTAMTGAWVYALYPGAWIACARYLTEPLFIFLSMAFIALFVTFMETRRSRHLILAGVCCGLAVMCKSVAGLLPVFLIGCATVLPAWKGARRNVLGGLSVCMAVVLCFVGGWVYRNYRLTGEIVYPSTIGGFALYTAHYYASHPDQSIRHSVHGAAFAAREFGERHGIRFDPRDRYPRWFYNPMDEVRFDRLTRQEAQARIAADRAGFARQVMGNLWRFWFGAPTTKSLIISVAINAPLLLLAVYGFFATQWWKSRELSLWMSVSAYYFLAHVAILAVVRYSLTVMPLVCMLAGVPLYRLIERFCHRSESGSGATGEVRPIQSFQETATLAGSERT